MQSSQSLLCWFALILWVCNTTEAGTKNHPEHLNGTLHCRAAPIVAKTTSQLFSLVPKAPNGQLAAPGYCSEAQVSTIDEWIVEATAMHNAAVWSYENLNYGTIILMREILGLGWGPGLQKSSENLWFEIEVRLNDVSKFLRGDGLKNRVSADPPYMFCGDEFATRVQFNQPARDSKGNYIPIGSGLATLDELFPSLGFFGRSPNSYWIDLFKGYYFDAYPVNLCQKQTVAARTFTKKYNFEDENLLDDGIKAGTYNSFITLCPSIWSFGTPFSGVAHSFPKLSTLATYDGYPVEDKTGTKRLNDFLPVSSTFYHELFHLADFNGLCQDPNYLMSEIYEEAEDFRGNVRCLHNAETWAYFAVASYILHNLPDTPAGMTDKSRILFKTGKSINYPNDQKYP